MRLPLVQFTPAASIPTFKLLDGAQLPVVGWGNGTGAAKEKAVQAGEWVLAAGLRHIDTAQGPLLRRRPSRRFSALISGCGLGAGYNNESTVPEVVGKSGVKRSEIWITSKR